MWFKWKTYSRRYDSMSLIYSFILKPKMEMFKETPQNEIISFLNILSDKAILLDNKGLNNGIWNFINKNKNHLFDLTTKEMLFNKKGSIIQLLNLFRYSNFFCFEYDLIEGCSRCSFNSQSKNYLNPYISFKEIDIDKKEKIENKFLTLMTNELTTCKIWGYENGKVFDANNPTFYRIISKKNFPKVIMIVFDLLNENDKGDEYTLELIEFQRRVQYNMHITDILQPTIEIEKHIYELKSIISTPQSDHFTCFLLDFDKNIYSLKTGFNYYYDGTTTLHDIQPIENAKDLIISKNPYVGIYVIH